jgi:hypothetical protein
MATQIKSSFFLALFLFAATLVPSQPALAQLQLKFNEKAELVGTGFVQLPQQGYSVAVSGDGNTAIVGGPLDNSGIGAAWVFTFSSLGWTQQGGKLFVTDAVGNAELGWSVALSANGNTAIVGGPLDSSGIGAAWVYTRSGSVWTQQGGKLVGVGAGAGAGVGSGVSLSADGNTAFVGGPGDNGNLGAVWVFTLSNGVWTQQGGKLVGTGAVPPAGQGFSVALSGDGYTALVGGPLDNTNIGATWVFTRSTRGVWTQQGNKLVGSGGASAQQGSGVALSTNGNTALVGGFEDHGGNGAAWVFTRSRGGWTQQGSKLAGTGLAGSGVALSGDGNTAIVGAPGAGVSVYARSSRGLWTPQGSIITGMGSFGQSVSLSSLGRTLLIGAPTDTGGIGAAWVYVRSQN